jgi:hypothetical protein
MTPAATAAPGYIDASELKKRRLSPAEFASFQQGQRQQNEDKIKAIAESKEKRRGRFEAISERNERGQPLLARQMEMLLEKLQKQKEIELATKKTAAAAAAAAAAVAKKK